VVEDTTSIVSSTTGRAIAQVTDEDLWLPPPVLREDGSLATPLPRLKPQLEGFIVQWVFDEAREQRALTALANKTPLSSVQDRRLLAVTRSGRKTITEELRALLPTLLPDRCQGLSRDFLAHFEFREAPPPGLTPLPRCVVFAQSRLGIQDLKTFNLRHDRLTAMSARVAVQWVREIARQLSLFFQCLDEPVVCGELRAEHLQGADFLVASPDEAMVLRHTLPGLPVLPVARAKRIGLKDLVGTIVLPPESFTCDSRERFDRWDVIAQCEFTVWFDPEKISLLRLAKVPQTGMSVEVL